MTELTTDRLRELVAAICSAFLCEPAIAATALSAFDFVKSMGVVTHLDQGYSPTAYAQMLQYMGMMSERDGNNRGNATPALTVFRATGAKFSITGHSLDFTTAKALANEGGLIAVEGPNEPNNFSFTYNGETCGGHNSNSWLPCAKFQRDFYAAAKADPVIKNYPVFNLSEPGAENDNVGLQWNRIPTTLPAGVIMPAGTKYADYANDHNYVVSNCPTLKDNMAWNAASPAYAPCVDGFYWNHVLTWNKRFSGYLQSSASTVPRVTTETGWGTGGTHPLTEEQQGRLYLNVYSAQFKRGWAYTFIYQMRDGEGGDTAKFGLFHSDKTPKRAASYIKNMISIIKTPGKPAIKGSLAYTISSPPITVHDLLLQKQDGSFWLVVWDERVSGSDTITIGLPSSSHVEIYDPVTGTSPIKVLDTAAVLLTLSDHPVVLRIM